MSVIPFGEKGEGGDGPDDPMLERRVARLEDKVDRIEAAIIRIEPRISEIAGELRHLPKSNDIGLLRADIDEIRGRLSMLPTWWMLVVALTATWSAGAGIVLALVKVSHS
ncbi:MAG: hypothetical protein ABSG83_17670 [Roseiarcus sp.]|jgi:hypothetical protein